MRISKTFKAEPLLIVPFGAVPKEVLECLQVELPRRFSFDIRIYKAEPIPQNAFNPKRNQYHSAKILKWLRGLQAKEERMLGIIDADLYVPELNFVFGEAHFAEKVCIISLERLHQEYYGLPENEKSLLITNLKRGGSRAWSHL